MKGFQNAAKQFEQQLLPPVPLGAWGKLAVQLKRGEGSCSALRIFRMKLLEYFMELCAR